MTGDELQETKEDRAYLGDEFGQYACGIIDKLIAEVERLQERDEMLVDMLQELKVDESDWFSGCSVLMDKLSRLDKIEAAISREADEPFYFTNRYLWVKWYMGKNNCSIEEARAVAFERFGFLAG